MSVHYSVIPSQRTSSWAKGLTYTLSVLETCSLKKTMEWKSTDREGEKTSMYIMLFAIYIAPWSFKYYGTVKRRQIQNIEEAAIILGVSLSCNFSSVNVYLLVIW